MEDVGSLGNLSEGREEADDETNLNTTNKTKQARGGQNEMNVPMVVGRVTANQKRRIGKDQRRSTCCNCGMVGHIAKDRRRKGRAKGKEETEARDTPRVGAT